MRYIISTILIVFAVLILLFFSHYHGTIIPYPYLWVLAAIFALGLGIFIIFRGSVFTKKERQIIIEDFEEIKNSGTKIQVNFSDCTIKSNSFVEEKPRSSDYRVQSLDAIYDPNRTVISKEVNQSIIVYDTVIDGEKKRFQSGILNKDRITLEFLLANKRETNIYLYQDKYFFDLDFLTE